MLVYIDDIREKEAMIIAMAVVNMKKRSRMLDAFARGPMESLRVSALVRRRLCE